MNLGKLSLVTFISTTLATCLFAQDTTQKKEYTERQSFPDELIGKKVPNTYVASSLEKAFKHGKFSGELKMMYASTNNNNGKAFFDNQDGFAVGGELNYQTGDFHGFKLGVTVQTSHQMGHQNEDSNRREPRLSFTNTNLSQAYLEYNFDQKTSVKLGRQQLRSPLISYVKNEWMMRDSFEAYILNTKAVPNTELWGGVVTKYLQNDAGRTSADTVDFHDPIYTIFAKNTNVIGGLGLMGQILYMDGENKSLDVGGPHPILEQNFLYSFFGATYDLPTSIPLTIRGMYYNLDYDTIQDADQYTLGATLGLGDFKFHFDYGKVSDEQSTIGTVGDVPTYNYNIMQINDGSFAGMESMVFKVDLDMEGLFGLTGFESFRLVHGRYDSSSSTNTSRPAIESQETSIDIVYNHSNLLKNLMTRWRFSNAHFDKFMGQETDDEEQEIRILAVYKF